LEVAKRTADEDQTHEEIRDGSPLNRKRGKVHETTGPLR
jgi:hypothetical protein